MCLENRFFGGFCRGTNMSHAGSRGLASPAFTGGNSTKVEPSQFDPWRGEYAGVEGSESINVPKDLADIGGDMGPGEEGDRAGMGDIGGKGDLGSLVLGRGDGGRPEKRWCGVTRLFGESSDGSFGMPWLVKAEYSVREPERL